MIALESRGFQRREMPVDTLYQLGTSPPSINLFYSFRHLTIRTSQGMQEPVTKTLHQNVGKSDIEQPLRSCLRILDKPKEMVSSYQSYTIPNDTNDDVIFHQTPPPLRTKDKRSSSSSSSSVAEKLDILKPNKKKVSFADSKGLKLHTIRVMDGPSDSPPLLSINLFKDVIQDERAEPNHPYHYVPDFDQPASDYLDFRDRLEKNNVCLENVMIKDNLTIMGTAKVRNIAFEKSVKIRVTFDKWKTYRDIPAVYVFPATHGEEQGASTSDKYDTFSFQFDLPPNLGGRAAHFCVCFVCNGKTFWDNNKNINYRIISLQEKETSEHDRMVSHYESLSGDYPWTDVSFYNLADKERPYW